tara:strand:+ start:7017 stop:8231 length:1215 start_codon:yes stop_codon:yes gene_type:complete
LARNPKKIIKKMNLLRNKKKICIASCSRADYGLQKKIIKLFKNDTNLLTYFVITGSHFSLKHGNSINEIHEDKIKIDKKIKIFNFEGSIKSINSSYLEIFNAFSNFLQKKHIDLVILVGDRFEILSIASASLIMRIPIAHIHGGELTEASIDNSIRHAVTKISNLHFVSNNTYKNRVQQMGEDPDYVFNVGGLGVDAMTSIKYMRKNELEKELKFKFWKKNILVTYHPETFNDKLSLNNFNKLLNTIKKNKDIFFIFTFPNIDHNNIQYIKKIKILSKKERHIIYFKSLGQRKYFSILKYIDAVMGNSSSGILEAPYFKIGTINIGERQKGRLRSPSVIDSKPKEKDINNAINLLYSKKFREKLMKKYYVHGRSGASLKIYKIIKDKIYKNKLNLIKKFNDIKK